MSLADACSPHPCRLVNNNGHARTPARDRDVSEAEARLARQAALVAQLAAKGLDTTLAEAALGVQESELNALLVQRRSRHADARHRRTRYTLPL